jgi:hypothetical protein
MMRVLLRAEFQNLEVNPKAVWRELGYSNPAQARPVIQEAFRQAIEMGQTALEPAACYDIFQIERVTSSSVEVEGGVSFESQDLAHRHREAKELAAFIVTIGPRLEEQVVKLFQDGNPAVGCFLDTFGSIAVDMVAYKVKELIQDDALARDYQTMTCEYCIGNDCPAYKDCGGVIIHWWSPGYGDWNTREQKKLFTLVDGSRIGIHLNETGMMTPRKSYSCALPIGSQREKPPDKCDEGKRAWLQRGRR